MSDRVKDTFRGRYAAPSIEVTRYRQSRHWAVYVDGELLAVTVYRKGAEAVRRALEDQAPA